MPSTGSIRLRTGAISWARRWCRASLFGVMAACPRRPATWKLSREHTGLEIGQVVIDWAGLMVRRYLRTRQVCGMSSQPVYRTELLSGSH